MKTTKTFEIEIMRHNVTPAQFLAYVRGRVDAKGGRWIRSDLDLKYFAAGDDMNFSSTDGTPETRPCAAEKSTSRPYVMQTYILNFDGSCYNEICEFDFDDDKTGYGYYYLVNVEVAEEDRAANIAEYLAGVARRTAKKIERNAAEADRIRRWIETESKWTADWYVDMKKRDADLLDRENEGLQKIVEECRNACEV